MKKSITIGAFILVLAFVGYTQAVPQGNPFQGLLALISGLDTRVTDLEASGGDGGDNLMIVDSSVPPKQVGEATTFGNTLFSYNGQFFNLPINPTGYPFTALKFESSDCGVSNEDDPVLRAKDSFTLQAVVNSPGNTLYVERPGSSALRTFLSDLDDDGITCSPVNEVDVNSVIMDPIVDLDTLFIPPFELVGDAPSLPLP